ncbi:MXAN_6577-like cysteine-rich protein [Labilithrix luteola]|uniref:MXAN_6577-like cysteine-rich protein n=1 Tax=Labilithrix luteola TaxID=1391654 RepID=UPI0011BA9B6A|nr:MXAN_6577-like cysteine-rich protein [Labilithrix luteola]
MTRAFAFGALFALVVVGTACAGAVDEVTGGLDAEADGRAEASSPEEVRTDASPAEASVDGAVDVDGSDASADTSGDASDRDDGGDVPAPCAGSLAHCGAECVDVQTDPRNCSACGNACTAGGTCAQGSCVLVCPAGTSACDGTCVALASDSWHCGDCATQCGPAAFCQNGQCHALTPDGGVCEAPSRLCNGRCVDTSTDSTNCGACNALCGTGRICRAGTCQCPEGRSACSGTCVDLATDVLNCGTCGSTCGMFRACEGGACVCAPGTTSCNGKCSDITIDADNCGGCGNSCGPGKVCTAGLCRGAVSNWPMFGGNAQHTGTSTTETAHPPAIRRWSRRIRPLNGWGGVHGVAVLGERIVVSADGSFDSARPVSVLHASDGTELWTHDFGSVFSVGWPAAVDGVVYVQQNKGAGIGPSALWAFDITNGNTKWSAPFGSQWENFYPPTIADGSVFIDGGYYGGLYGFSAVDGAQRFFENTLAQYDEWSPAYDDGVVYTLVGEVFTAHDPATGKKLWSVTAPRMWRGWSMETSAVLAGGAPSSSPHRTSWRSISPRRPWRGALVRTMARRQRFRGASSTLFRMARFALTT